jgi:acyl-homoserine-lactone acylase
MKTILTAALALAAMGSWAAAEASPDKAGSGEAARWKAEAARVDIVRDSWGVAHIHGKSDADAVFGMIYAQAEDDFPRIESNYLDALGLWAEAKGEQALYVDLRQRLFVDPVDLKRRYARSPAWLKALMSAWADGLNYYLATHPKTPVRVLHHFEPWMALSFTEGSIGGDIERIRTEDLAKFYGAPKDLAMIAPFQRPVQMEPGGSNGFAIAPKNTRDHHALLWINPHTSFFFRSEAKVESEEGLNAYGASTWGQFFIYQGFNNHAGWMHTSTRADVVDEFAETIVKKDGKLFYRYGTALKPVASSKITLRYKAGDGFAARSFTTYRTGHGPIIRDQNGKWIAISLMYKPVEALEQSYLRTKAKDFKSFKAIAARLKANSSNNTIFADDRGEIAYMHPHFIPKRNDRFDYTKPVDGSDPSTDWQGLHELDEAPHLLNPQVGWLYNTNNWPYTAAGPDSPKAADYPRYMDDAGENPRGRHALLVLSKTHDFTKQSLVKAAFDPYQPAFARLIPPLLAAYDSPPTDAPLKAKLAEPVAALRGWDFKWSAASVPQSLASFWGDELIARFKGEIGDQFPDDYIAAHVSPADQLAALAAAVDRLNTDFGTWNTPWGEINRFQRLTGDVVAVHDDAKPSTPVPFASATWGSLAAFGAQRYPGTKRLYGYKGNSFLAAVEFGPKVSAIAVSAGGESGDPASPHFTDQAARYAAGDLRPIYFYAEDLKGHVERRYRPGE